MENVNRLDEQEIYYDTWGSLCGRTKEIHGNERRIFDNVKVKIIDKNGAVIEESQKVLFKQGPFIEATNNIGEFLALVHGLAMLKKLKSDKLIYSDSITAISWVKKKKCQTKLKPNKNNKEIFILIERAINWLKSNSYETQILKWETKKWGEIPADFGRK